MADQVADAVRRAVADVCGRPARDIRATDSLKGDLKMDRIAILQVVSTLAETFQLDVESREARSMRTVKAVEDFFRAKRP